MGADKGIIEAMFWIVLVLAVPSLALVAAIWGVVRRKWYGVIPLLAIASLGWLFEDSWWNSAKDFFEACANQSPQNQVMLLLLADGAAVMSLAALWAGWSRGNWFWRALILALVPASLVPLEASELILICFFSMPLLATAAWVLRNRQERIRRTADASARVDPEPLAPSRRQFTLLSLLLAFVVFGLLATSLRALLTGHILLGDSGVLWLGAFVATAALFAASPSLSREVGFRWLMAFTGGVVVTYGIWKWLNWKIDPLGLVTYLRLNRFPMVIAVYQLEATGCFLIAIALTASFYLLSERSDKEKYPGKLLRFAAPVLMVLLIAPIAAVYREMIPASPTITPLSASPEYDTIQRAGLQIRQLESQNAVRARFLHAFLELDRALPRSGHMTYDPGELIQEQLYPRGVDPDESLRNELVGEITRAFHDGRTADALRLARLHWRVGQSYFVGGTFTDYLRASHTIRLCANPAVIAAAPTLSEQECRELLAESQRLEQAEPEFQPLHDFDEYWRRVGVGWRENLHHAAAWLIGAKNLKNERISPEAFQQWHRQARASHHSVQHVLALELFRHEHGNYPESLAEVQSAYQLPALSDPFTEQPQVVYRRTPSGYQLYSLGVNGRDDEGNFLPPDGQTFGIPWSVRPDINIAVGPSEMAHLWRRAAGLPLTAPAP
jgi:hypothetical protein